MNVEQRIEMEKRIVRHLCDTLRSKGWIATHVNDGGDDDEPVSDTEEVVDAVFAVDTATIHFRKQVAPGIGKTHFAMIVLGNDGYDCIADYSYSATDDFGEIMEGVIAPFCDELAREVGA